MPRGPDADAQIRTVVGEALAFVAETARRLGSSSIWAAHRAAEVSAIRSDPAGVSEPDPNAIH
jgi:hypothetical protein